MTMRTWRGTVLFTGTLATLAVAAGSKFASADSATIAAATTGTGTTTQSGAAAAGTTTQPATTSGAAAGSTASKVVTGSAVSMPYGTVQVAVTFTGGKITSVQTLKAPSGGRSGQINSYATPILGQEAVAANSASIDSVSGATFTSEAYMQSLQSAIDKKG